MVKELLLRIEELLYLSVTLGLILVFGLTFIDGLLILIKLPQSDNLGYEATRFLDKILVALIEVNLLSDRDGPYRFVGVYIYSSYVFISP